MSLGLITKERPYNKALERDIKSPLSEVNTGSPLFLIDINVDGETEAIYNVNIIYLLDKVFVNDSLRFLTIEQERYFTKYFSEAGIVTDYMNNGEEDPFKDMDIVMKQLDNFLGSYLGVNSGRFTK